MDACDDDHATPLHFAASKGHVEVVQWLLQNGAAILPDKFGKTPLDDSIENGMDEVRSELTRQIRSGTLQTFGSYFCYTDTRSLKGNTYTH